MPCAFTHPRKNIRKDTSGRLSGQAGMAQPSARFYFRGALCIQKKAAWNTETIQTEITIRIHRSVLDRVLEYCTCKAALMVCKYGRMF